MPRPAFVIVTGTVAAWLAAKVGSVPTVYVALKSTDTPVGVSSGAMPLSANANSFTL